MRLFHDVTPVGLGSGEQQKTWKSWQNRGQQRRWKNSFAANAPGGQTWADATEEEAYDADDEDADIDDDAC